MNDSEGIGLRNRQVPPCVEIYPPLEAVEGEETEAEELVQREASIPPQQFEFEDAIPLASLTVWRTC
jgi:hypothetical protein